MGLDFSWELDLWGRIRRTVESNQASAQASAGDLESARLSFQAELAQDYFQLRTVDAQKQLLDATVAAFEKSLELTKNQYASGVASQADVVQAETQLKTTQAQAIDVGVQRAQLEHAIALLIGKPASNFSLPTAPLATTPPPIPVGVPSALLERRPDIAAAERRVAAANAEIGVAVAAFYPTVTLSASSGFESSSLSQWLTAPSRFWSVGPSISETVFDGGLRRAQTDFARAGYDASVGTYRQTVLTAFQAVEDNLAALRILEQEAQVQDEAVTGRAEIRDADHEPVQGGHRQLSQRDHRPDDRADQRDDRGPDPRPADERRRAADPGPGRRLERRRPALGPSGDEVAIRTATRDGVSNRPQPCRRSHRLPLGPSIGVWRVWCRLAPLP